MPCLLRRQGPIGCCQCFSSLAVAFIFVAIVASAAFGLGGGIAILAVSQQRLVGSTAHIGFALSISPTKFNILKAALATLFGGVARAKRPRLACRNDSRQRYRS